MTPRLMRTAARLLHRRVAALPAGFPPTVSFTFDDFPVSAAANAAPLLEAAGMRGTWYVAAGLMGQDTPVGPVADAALAAALVERGHEIGCHTFSHLRASEADGARYAADIASNRAALAALLPAGRDVSFSFPFGDVTPGAKAAAAAMSATCRGIHAGIARGRLDLSLLPAHALYGDGTADLPPLLRRLSSEGGWLVLYTHDVTGTPSPWGCTPRRFAAAVEAVAAAGLSVRTMGAVAAALRAHG